MIDAATLQAFAAVCAMLVAALVAICGWVYWQLRDMERRMDRMEQRLIDRMDSMERRLTEQMDRNHRDILILLEGHTHADGTPAVFRHVTPAADG